jgi:hypothetical protein
VKSAESADKTLVEKDRKAERVLLDITKVQQKSQAAADGAQVCHFYASHHHCGFLLQEINLIPPPLLIPS